MAFAVALRPAALLQSSLNAEPFCNLLVGESDSYQFGGTFTALLTKPLLLFSGFSDSHGSFRRFTVNAAAAFVGACARCLRCGAQIRSLSASPTRLHFYLTGR